MKLLCCLNAALAVVLVAGPLGCADSSAQEPVVAAAPGEVAARQRVRVHRVETAALEGRDQVSGIARAFHNAQVTAEVAGRVIARKVERGAHVEAGQVLVELDASRLRLELRRAEATLTARRHDLEHAQREHERGERMVSRSAISEQQRDDLHHALDRARDELALASVARDTARRNLRDASISAPFAGTVDDLHVDIGDYVKEGSPVATVIELSRVRVFAGVTAQQAAQLGRTASASVSFAALDGQALSARLKSVSRVANPRDGTYTVELWIDAPPAGLRDGMVASVELPRAAQQPRPLAPRAALMRTAGQPEVFVVELENETPVARLRSLRTGRSAGDWIEVLEGLRDGDEVIVEGQFALREGAAVTIDGRPRRAN